ncbi:MAG: hypothetical protein LBJ84_00470, partial [Oscillospiraceae bacterium]|nr:hypothetical protein [Oscillospiraceae bacterium]
MLALVILAAMLPVIFFSGSDAVSDDASDDVPADEREELPEQPISEEHEELPPDEEESMALPAPVPVDLSYDGDEPTAGTLTFDEISYNSVKLTSTGHALGGAAFVSGGFRYSARPDMLASIDVPWNLGSFTSSPVSKTAAQLAPDTVYYAQIYLNTSFAGGAVYSTAAMFKTLPHAVIDLSATTASGDGYTVTGTPPYQTLNIYSSIGSPYIIIQSDGNDPSTSIFQNIVVDRDPGTSAMTIMIRDINMECYEDDTPVFSVRPGAGSWNLNLLIDGENTMIQRASGAGNNAALSASRPNEGNFNTSAGVNIDTVAGGTGSLTAKGGAGGAGIGGGEKGLCGQIIIKSGNITAEGGAGANGGAGIGSNGGYKKGDSQVYIGGGTVEATGGAGSESGGAGIGIGGNCIINRTYTYVYGTSEVAAAGGAGNSGGAGIGAGGNSICGAGNNYFQDIMIHDTAKVAATGGAGTYGGAGIGGGGADIDYADQGRGGDVSITGTAKVVTTGGFGSSSSGAGIGGGGGSGTGIAGSGAAKLVLTSTVEVQAYSYSSDHPAI